MERTITRATASFCEIQCSKGVTNQSRVIFDSPLIESSEMNGAGGGVDEIKEKQGEKKI